MRTLHVLALAAALGALFVSVVPTAAADTCASAIAEETICPPILGAYCTLYAVVEKGDLVACALRAVPGLPGELAWSLP